MDGSNMKPCNLHGSRFLMSLLLALIVASVLLYLLGLLFVPVLTVKATTKYTYYGKVPNRLWMYSWSRTSGWTSTTPGTAMLLAMVAWEDSTIVNVYNLETGELLSQAMLNTMEKHYVVLSNGTIFKVESNKPLCVLLLNYGSEPVNATAGPVPHTYYPATDGSFVGKKFILLASTGATAEFIIYALEKSEVTVTNQDGSDTRSYSIDVNTYVRIALRPWNVYKIESTGYIMIQSGNPHSYYDTHPSYAIPSANGAFLGRYFLTFSSSYWDPYEDYGFIILSLNRTKVKVYNLTERKILKEFTVEPESSYRFQVEVREDPRTQAIFVESEEPVWLMFMHEGDIYKSVGRESAYGAGIIYIGVRPNEDTLIYLPKNATCETYIFAAEEANIEVDGFATRLQPDRYFQLAQPGLHTIRSDKNLMVLIIHWPLERPWGFPERQLPPGPQGLDHPGTIIPCVETVHIYHEIQLAPLEQPFPIMNVIVPVVAIAIIAGILVLLRRRSK
ncbi:MAG: hypothetical protein QXV71_04790 [Candidatus Bathyarchaeia archaeon]